MYPFTLNLPKGPTNGPPQRPQVRESMIETNMKLLEPEEMSTCQVALK